MKQYLFYILSVLIIFLIVGCSTSQDKIENSQVHKKPLIKKEKYKYIKYDSTMPTTSLYRYDANDENDPINAELERNKNEGREEIRRKQIRDCLVRSSEAGKNGCYSQYSY